jgi:hypothetical protein
LLLQFKTYTPMTRILPVTFLLFLMAGVAVAQVDEIKSASSSKGQGEARGGGSSGGSGNFMVDFFFQFMFAEMIKAQQQKVSRKHEIPSIISFDVMLQAAAQPSSYYIMHPRVRGNWGLFSTDFRLNYILEEDIDGVKHLRTNEWQVLQLNLVTTKDATVRIGGGMLYEAFEMKRSYPEWTAGVHIMPFGKLGGVAEYRGSEVRKEVNAHFRYGFFERNRLHGYLTAGAVYQRYYSQVSVWGMQGGLVLSFY